MNNSISKGLATAIGSFPHQDPGQAVDLILENLKEIPSWPQLTQRSFFENMYLQYTEGLPCLRINPEEERVWVDTTCELELELERFYERYLCNDLEYFQIGRDYAQGLYTLIERLEGREDLNYIKGQVTGPITLGLTLKDQNGWAIFHNREVMDALVKGLEMKARWQSKLFIDLGTKAIIFFDEPYLSNFGSTFFNIGREEVTAKLNEVILPLKEMGVMTGIHCCGNTDWSVLLATEADIINFDAYNFIEGISLYAKDLKEFLVRGGILAWGIVPSSSKIKGENTESLVRRLEEGRNLLTKRGIDKDLLDTYIITPSCGVGSLSIEEAQRVLELTHDLSQVLRRAED